MSRIQVAAWAFVVSLITFPVSTLANDATVEVRLQKLERMLEAGGLLQLMQEVDRLRNEVNQLRGQLEEKDFELSEIKRRQRDLYTDIEQRFRQMRSADSPAVATATPAAAAPSSDTPAPSPAIAISNSDKDAYQTAYALVKAQKFPEAEVQLAAFTNKFPKSNFADNAYYWLGEVQLVQGKNIDALKSFNKVFEYADSTKRPDALLKIGYAYYELEQWAQARKFLEQLQKVFPDAGAARLGKAKLDQMRKEGR